MAQQTAVDWFQKESWALHVELENKEVSTGEFAVRYKELVEQAKEKERQMVVDAVNDTDKDNLIFVKKLLGTDIRAYQIYHDNKTGEEYFNKKFN
jgi:hypothetical protein